MRRSLAAVLVVSFGFCGPVAANAQSQPTVITPDSNSAQDDSVIAVPAAPAIVAAPLAPATAPPIVPATPPPGLVPVSPPPDSAVNGDTNTDTGGDATAAPGQDGTSPGQAPDTDTIPTTPNAWVPGTLAKIGVLDKIDGGVSVVSIPVGGQSTVGDLQVNVLACVIRPPGQVPDTAIFLALQNTADPSAPPNYRGWLVRSAPGAAVAGDASETFRVIDCS